MFLFLLPPVLPHPLDLLFPEDDSAVAKFLDGIGPDPGGFVGNFMEEPIARSASGKMKEVEEVATRLQTALAEGLPRRMRTSALLSPRKGFSKMEQAYAHQEGGTPLGKETVFSRRNGPHQAAG